MLPVKFLCASCLAALLAACVRRDPPPQPRFTPMPAYSVPTRARPLRATLAAVPATAALSPPGAIALVRAPAGSRRVPVSLPETPLRPAASLRPATTALLPAQPLAPPPTPQLPAGTKVLHVGDSFAGALGIALNAELKRAQVRGFLRFKTATFIPDWAWGSKLPLYIAQTNPDLVLINLGANEIKIFNPEQRAKTIQKLVGHVQGRPCVWISPPLWAGDTGIVSVIRANCAPCRFLDSSALFPDMPRLPDKIHPTFPAREEWARRVVDWLARERRPTVERPWELAPEPQP